MQNNTVPKKTPKFLIINRQSNELDAQFSELFGRCNNNIDDTRSVSIKRLYIPKIKLVTALRTGEQSRQGGVWLKRLKDEPYIRLDVKVYEAFLNKPTKIPESWKEQVNGQPLRVCFFGSSLIEPVGWIVAPSIYWDGSIWRHQAIPFASHFGAHYRVAVVET